MFRRDPAASHYPDPPATPAKGQVPWNYDRVEIVADGIVHAAGIVLGVAGTVVLLLIAVKLKPVELAPIAIYALGLLVMLGISAAYNMWPVSPTKWLLRRLDHSAIYLLIAGTYTPFLALLKTGLASAVLAIGIDREGCFIGCRLVIARGLDARAVRLDADRRALAVPHVFKIDKRLLAHRILRKLWRSARRSHRDKQDPDQKFHLKPPPLTWAQGL